MTHLVDTSVLKRLSVPAVRAAVDELTGLVNRAHFTQAISRCLENRRLTDGAQFSVLYLDLDGFKLINDSLGHSAGDEFLVHVSRRVQRRLRPHDGWRAVPPPA